MPIQGTVVFMFSGISNLVCSFKISETLGIGYVSYPAVTAPEILTGADCPYSEWYLTFMLSNKTIRDCRVLPVRGFDLFRFSKNLTFDPETQILAYWYFRVIFCLSEPDEQKYMKIIIWIVCPTLVVQLVASYFSLVSS